jgi:hypothetical protein
MTNEQEIIIVHSGESKTFHYNPATHGELREEMADGGMMLSVVPLEVLEERRWVMDEEARLSRN